MLRWARRKPAYAESPYLKLFDHMAQRSSKAVIGTYSSSFSLATLLLSKTIRTDIHNLYAIVRIADEIVDGTAAAAGLSPDEIAAALNDYENHVLAAAHTHFHSDPILHAFGITARRCRFNPEHLRAFFASMRSDLTETSYDDHGLATYIYGSAEVIGLMCLSIFLSGSPATSEQEIGARALGAAFQKINFLRDFAEDSQVLGRRYFPKTQTLTETRKAELITEIRADLNRANMAIPLLPGRCLIAVLVATKLFTELSARLDQIPADKLNHQRVRIPGWRKLIITSCAVVQGGKLIAKKNTAQKNARKT